MDDKERDLIITSLADTLAKTRVELDAIRIVTIGSLVALSLQPPLTAQLATQISAAIEAHDTAVLNSLIPDESLELRDAWLLKLIPPHLQLAIWPDRDPK